MNMNGKVVNKYIPVTTANDAGKSNYGGAIELLRYHDTLYFCDGFRSKIYSLEKDDIFIEYNFDFNELTIPEDVNINNYDFGNDFPYVSKPRFFVTSQYCVINFYVPNQQRAYYSFLNRTTGEIRSGSIHYKEDTLPFAPQAQDNEHLVGLFTYGDLYGYNKAIATKIAENVNSDQLDDDTSILMFYSLK
ncbi:hypothetical protein FACS189464_0950 [Bacteroidia bacterium]|nr:hypothetical protein FACS189464_0950 [Bacteroidia bacterium]